MEQDLIGVVLLWTCAGAVAVAVFLSALRAASGAPWRRRIAVSLQVTAASMAPALAWTFAPLLPLGGDSQHRGSIGLAGLGLGLCGVLWTLRFVVSPGTVRKGLGRALALPPLVDPGLLARISDLSARLGMKPPRALVLGSTGGTLRAQAFAGGLAVPTLVVADGVLHRLDAQERDAVLGHELAHLTGGRLWALAMIGPLAAPIATAVCIEQPAISILLFLALLFGARRFVGRVVEESCDRASAGINGFAAMARALDKVHASQQLPPGLRYRLFHAISSHPTPRVRRAALWRAAPEAARDALEFDRAEAKAERRWALGALVVWVAAMLIAAALIVAGAVPAAAALLLALILLPTALQLAIFSRRLRRQARRLGSAGRTVRALVSLFVLVMGLTLIVIDMRAISSRGFGLTGWIGFGMIAAGIVMTRFVRTGDRRLRGRVLAGIRDRRYDLALQVQRENPVAVARDPVLRHDIALARAFSGDPEGAATELGAIAAERPRFRIARLTQALVLCEVDPARALAAAEAAQKTLSDDPGPPIVCARALLSLGRLDEARDAAAVARALEPADGTAPAIAAMIALAAGDAERARSLLEIASELSPGDAYVLLARAQLELARDPSGAEGAVRAAIAAAAANPFAFLGPPSRKLLERLPASPADRATGG